MSWDVSLEDSRGRRVGDLAVNCTYNLGPMFRAAAETTPSLWHGRRADEVAQLCEQILTAMEADPRRFLRLNPANGWGDYGWGDYGWAMKFSRLVWHACLIKPRAFVRVG